ncbi:MAG: site-specific DNA-methyltransferase [Acidimicrobiia bacterium]|nr:site-specific DNA-methyltransferase [Acidimicrobiia bacterium]MYC57799.1 site-specific DNA-methyltransferase [Acidimicrobiia bacterium]MYH98899.1 site-specific DNA-methyltransferase [Acidimicrobiia bacterium]
MMDEPEGIDLSTPDIAAANRKVLEAMLPGVIADGVLDATSLGELLNIPVTAPVDGRERFGLMWAGKNEAIRSLLTPSRGTLVPDLERSVDFDTARNVFIEGDNLEVLKLLQKAYNDKIKLIYIDPPYNTGNDFVYNDDFTDGLRGYLEYTGQLDEEGNRTSASSDTSGRKHSKWLSMMYPRLVLARNLLTQDGVLAVSIDDNEFANLRAMLDEVFGSENFLNAFIWASNIKGRQISGSGAVGTKEYILVYARNESVLGSFRASAQLLKDLMPSIYKGFDYELKEDGIGPYVTKNQLYNTNSAFNEETRPNLVYDIYYRPTDESVKTADCSDNHVFDGYWKIPPKRNNNGTHKYHAFRWSRAKVESESYDLEFVEQNGEYRVFTKVRDVASTSVKDLIMDISTNQGSKDLEEAGIDGSWFDYPKPVSLIQLFCGFATDKDSLVLDFFAGSGATAHAVAAQNALDGGNRRCISVNLPEPVDAESAAGEAGFKTVSEITYRRIEGVMANVPNASQLGLRVYSLAPSLFRRGQVVETMPLFDMSDRTLLADTLDAEFVSTEILVKEGIPLDSQLNREYAASEPLVQADGVAVVQSLELTDEVVEATFRLSHRVVVFLEDGFAGKDSVKANAFTRARELGITMKTV